MKTLNPFLSAFNTMIPFNISLLMSQRASLVAATLLSLSLTGCNGSDGDDNATTELENNTQEVVENDSTPPPTGNLVEEGEQTADSQESEEQNEGQNEEQNEDQNDAGRKPYVVIEGTDLNRITSPALSLNPGGPGGSPNQSLRAGDVLIANHYDTTIIGGLGVDVLVGNKGDDILIGGTEDFNSNVDGDAKGADNRDRAFGQQGDDLFIWAPGDGSDFFDGGPGTDIVMFGILGEKQDSDGSTEGAPFFNVNPPNRDGSQDFDGIFLDEENKPTVSLTTSPGFCSVIDTTTHAEELNLLNIDHVVRFSLRAIANDFDANLREDDDGLRVAVSLKDVEYLVCTPRETTETLNESDNIEVLDLTTTPPTLAQLSDLPEHVAAMIR